MGLRLCCHIAFLIEVRGQWLFHKQKAIPSQASAQIQCWVLALAAYQYQIVFKSTASHGNADATSCLPLLSGGELEPPVPTETILLMEHLDRSPITALQIKQWTGCDPLLATVIRQVQEGWPEHCTAEELRPFASRSTELSVHDGCSLWRNHVIAPLQGRKQILAELHSGHLGVSHMKSLAQMFVW